MKKKQLGQYYTKHPFWLKPHILEFITNINPEIIIDPFAGEGDLLNVMDSIGYKNLIGLDIDTDLSWKINDSLKYIPKYNNSIIITNPPYLAKYSAARQNLSDVDSYFNICDYTDIYQIAINKCMENNDYGVMIIPETFINSTFSKYRLTSITIIEDLMFNDTDCPVCVICFDNTYKNYNDIKVYKNDTYINTLGYLEMKRKIPTNSIGIQFNCKSGRIALRGVDSTDGNKNIKFLLPKDIEYDISNIKHSSRSITLIKVNIENKEIPRIIKYSNEILNTFRYETQDILLSPFKGNNKKGKRRRRLDYRTARAILEESYDKLNTNTLF